LETGEADAAGLLVSDVVIHVGADSAVTLLDEPGVTRVVIERGFMVFYTDPTTQTKIVAETPFGFLAAMPSTAQTGGSGWYWASRNNNPNDSWSCGPVSLDPPQLRPFTLFLRDSLGTVRE